MKTVAYWTLAALTAHSHLFPSPLFKAAAFLKTKEENTSKMRPGSVGTYWVGWRASRVKIIERHSFETPVASSVCLMVHSC